MTTTSNRLVAQFNGLRTEYQAFLDNVQTLVITLLREAHIGIHGIEKRVKSAESLAGKLHHKSYASLDAIPDLAGLRIIVHHPDHVDHVVQMIQREFDVNEEESVDKAQQLAPHEFGYLSVHLVAWLSTDRQDLSEWRRFRELHVEVQVRTILQHAWASISHALQYKKEEDVPRALRRRLYRLAGLLELADQEFTTLSHEHNVLAKAEDPGAEDILTVVRKVLGVRAHSFEWIRENAALQLSDEEFDKLIRANPATLQSTRIVHRDESGNRIIPGKPGMKVILETE